MIPFNSWGNVGLNRVLLKQPVKHRETSNFDIMHKEEKVLHTMLWLYKDLFLRSS